MNTGLLGGSVFFDCLGRASWQAAVLAGLVLIAQWLFRKRLTPAWRYRLWLLVVIRLVLPFPPTSLTSVFNIAHFRSGDPPVTLATRETRPGPPALLTTSERPDSGDRAIPPHHATAPDAPVAAEPAPPRPPHAVSWSTILGFLPWVWAAGVLFIATRMAWQNFRFGQRLRREATPVAASIQELFAHCQSLLDVRQPVVLCETSLVRSPALYGFLEARLLLPRGLAEAFSADELRYVLLHELAHVKRRGMAMKWLMALLQALHWFNPCLWVAFARMRLDRELACDALALSCARADETTRYGETIIRLLEGMTRGAAMPGLVGVLESRDQIRERIRMIATFKRPGRWSAMAVLLLLGLGVVGLTDASPEKPVEQQTSAATDRLPPKDGLAARSAVTNAQDRAKGLTIGSDGQLEVQGRVLDDQDHPIEGATVWDYPGGWKTRTDALGRFAFRRVKEDGTVFTQLGAVAKGQEPGHKLLRVKADMEEVVFRLAVGSVMRARIQNEVGEAVSGARVALDIWGGAWNYEFSTTTDRDGRFEWDSAPKEPTRFRFDADGYEKRRRVLEPDQDNVVTLRRIRRVQARIVDAGTGAPITRFRVGVGNAHGGVPSRFYLSSPGLRDQGDSNGAFTIDLSEEEENAIQAEADGYSNETELLPAARDGTVTAMVRLKPRSALVGIIVDADGRPVAGAAVAVTRTDREWESLFLVGGRLRANSDMAKVTATDEAGQFEISSPPETGVMIAVGEPGFASVPLAEVRASGTVMLRPFGRVEGIVKVGGKPVAGEELMLQLPIQTDFNGYRAVTDAEGLFAMEGRIPPGKVTLVRMVQIAPGCATSSHDTEVTVEPGRTTHVTLGNTGAVVRGRVRFETSLPPDRGVVTRGELSMPEPRFPDGLTPDQVDAYAESAEWKDKMSNWRRYAVKVETDGAMMVDSIPPGSYTLRVTASEAGLGPRNPKVVAKGEMPVTVPADASPTTTIALDELVLKPVSKPPSWRPPIR